MLAFAQPREVAFSVALDERKALSLHGPGQHDNRPPRLGLPERRGKRGGIVAVCLPDGPAKGAPTVRERLERYGGFRLAAELKAIAVHYGHQVVQAQVAGGHRRLPDRALLEFPVPHDDEAAAVAGSQCETVAESKPVAERTGRHLNSWHRPHRMSHQPAARLAKGRQLLNREETTLGQDRIERQRTMAFAEQQDVPVSRCGPGRVNSQHAKVQRGEDLNQRQRAAEMATIRARAHVHDVLARPVSHRGGSHPCFWLEWHHALRERGEMNRVNIYELARMCSIFRGWSSTLGSTLLAYPARPKASPLLKIICVMGWCRNGSTILGNVLGEVPGFFHAGELHFLWKNAAGRGANNLCGCGDALTSCPLWSQIIPVGRPPELSVDAHASIVVRRQRAYVRTRHTWRVLRQGPRSSDIRDHATMMARTYQAIAERTRARVIVDSTKIPGEAALVPHMTGLMPYYIHLVRDPRAAAESWRERKQYCAPMSPARSTAYWDGFNLASEAITRRYPQRSVFLRYEEFIADPAGTIGRLLRWCGADPAANPVHGRTVELHTNHTVTGNPDRFRTGATLIRDTDDAWQAALPRMSRLIAQTLSWPLAYRYGYRSQGASPARVMRSCTPAARATDKL